MLKHALRLLVLFPFTVVSAEVSTQADNAAFLDYFAQKIKVGTSGSGREKGLNGAKKFAENYGNTWLREDAYLVIVQISDEEDQSSLSTTEYINHLKSLKANDRLVTVHSVVNMSASQRYQAVSNDLNGTVSDIRNNFHDILDNMGGTILNLIKELGYDTNLRKYKIEINETSEIIKIKIDNYTYDVPLYLISNKLPEIISNNLIRKSLYFTRNIILNRFFLPNNLVFPKSRIIFENYFN